MRLKTILLTVTALVALTSVALVVYHATAPKQPLVCQICGRDVPKKTEFHIETTRGNLTACCPRCAMHYMLDHSGEIRGAHATDYVSGRLIEAKSAYYDEGGDVQYCTAHRPAVERGPNDGVRLRTYDRCLPVLVAFASREEAESYRREHGGRVLTYQQAIGSVRER
jgi:hypothetical protein